MTPLSILDLVRVTEETDARGALNNARDLAVHAEGWGYRRIWVAEHHNMPGIASAATGIVLAHIAEGTKTIRIGAGGIMLPNHAPYVIAEQFGTLARLFPGRVDLGLGRAPGTDQLTLRALRRTPEAAEGFPQDVLEVQAFLAPAGPAQRIQAVPAAGTNVPLWILGSSHFGAMVAAELGLPYAFASHFAPEQLIPALQIYRERFKPSEQLDRPVLDKTGLTNHYDLILQWEANPESSGAAISAALQEQLGLKLEPTQILKEFLVIDHVETPSAD